VSVNGERRVVRDEQAPVGLSGNATPLKANPCVRRAPTCKSYVSLPKPS
jgi:hypothetical protein